MDEYQLECMLEHIHYMSNTLGIAETVSQIDCPKDDFEKARLTYLMYIKLYEQKSKKLEEQFKMEAVEKIELQEDLYEMKKHLTKELKYMISHVEIKEKELRKLQSKSKDAHSQQKLKEQITYKKLECLNCQKSYVLLCGTLGKLPKAVTLQDLKTQKEAYEPMLDDNDQDRENQLFILERIRNVNQLIDSELDKIIEKIEVFKKQAITIGQAIEITHKQILMNLKVVRKNVEDVKTSNRELKKLVKLWRRPNCCLDVVLVLLLLILGYLIFRYIKQYNS